MADLTETQPSVSIADDEIPYHRLDAIGNAIRATSITGGAGLMLAAVQSTVAKENVGAFGVFSRFGSTIALFAAVGGSYAFVTAAAANLREKNDFYNHGLGGATAGAILGMRKRTFPSVLGNGLALGATMAIVYYTGSNVFGSQDIHQAEGQWPTKEEIRKRFRRPVNEVVNELGEGRGIYAPGYQERRKQRLKDNYGIEVEDPYWVTKKEPEPYRV